MRDASATDGTDCGRALRAIRVLITVALATAVATVATVSAAAVPAEGGVVAQQVISPERDADAKVWSGFLAPVPLWAQVFIVSAVSLAAFFFAPPAVHRFFRYLRPKGRPKGKHL